MRDIGRYLLSGDLVKPGRSDQLELGEPPCPAAIPDKRIALGSERGRNPGHELCAHELRQRRYRFLLADAHFALCQRRAMRRFYPARHSRVSLLGGFLDVLAVEVKVIPINLTALED